MSAVQIQKENPTVEVGLPAELGGAAGAPDSTVNPTSAQPEDEGDCLMAALLRAALSLGRLEARLVKMTADLDAAESIVGEAGNAG